MAIGAGRESRWPLGVVIVAAALARVFYYSYGQVRFDDTPLYYYLQFVDPLLLQNDLIRSVTHLHSQPPLFNLLVGVVLKVFPEHYTFAFNAIYVGLGATLIVCMFRLMRRFGAAGWLAALGARPLASRK